MKPLADSIMSLLVSKTLAVVVVATLLEYTDNLSIEWCIVASIYIGFQKTKDIWNLYFGNAPTKNKDNDSKEDY